MSSKWVPPTSQLQTELGADRYAALHDDTRLLAARVPAPDVRLTGEPLTVPIYHTSVYRNTSLQQYADILDTSGYIYQRLGNPTNETAELMINQLEGGAGTLLTCSGLAAMNQVFLTLLSAGDHMVCTAPCYSGTYKFISETLTRFGVDVSYVSASVEQPELERAIRDNTKLIYVETPGNPTMSVVDLAMLGALCRRRGLTSVVDGTFASPYHQQPIRLGVDIVLHSCSKYVGGHSDVIAGCITTAELGMWQCLKAHQATTGTALSALDASLLVRGLKTLSIRMQRHSENALAIAKFLEQHPKVVRVWYPGLPSHPQHAVASRQMARGFGGMISFVMRSADEAKRVVEAVRLINLAVSLGGTESLVEHPGSMTHGPMFGRAEGAQADTDPALIRLSVGLENVADLIEDLSTALKQLP